jgi:hypothetical protein
MLNILLHRRNRAGTVAGIILLTSGFESHDGVSRTAIGPSRVMGVSVAVALPGFMPMDRRPPRRL